MNDNIRYLTVNAINLYLTDRINKDINLQNIYLKAEISNAKMSGGNLYFSLKDEQSELSAVLYKNYIQLLNFSPEDGQKVIAYGSVQGYPARGRYTFICKSMEVEGLGKLYQDYLALKDKLAKEGLFDEAKKKPIPKYPERIGVITASTGQAIKDITTTINTRFPLAEIRLYPAQVQGAGGVESLIKALSNAIIDNNVDVLIIGRGGGSFEDLNNFNDEGLARLIASCPIPTISAVGHEGDFTICDFVSDLRAPTPTGAGALSTPDKKEIIEKLVLTEKRLTNDLSAILDNYVNSLAQFSNSLSLLSPKSMIDSLNQSLDGLNKRLSLLNLPDLIDNKLTDITSLVDKMKISLSHNVEVLEKDNSELVSKLILLNPLNVLQKGYAVVFKDKNIVSSVNDVESNDEIDIKVKDGTFKAIVKK